MEAQNHYYGHSGALARYVGLRGPRHIRGLVQHGWTAESPLETHFRDFPDIGARGGRDNRSLFVWSHSSRAWTPGAARTTVPIGAPWVYLCESMEPPPPGSGTVILPVHGIPTQRLHGDHARVAKDWADTEGPSTVCLYHVEAGDPRVVAAYRDAGHSLVMLGARTDPAFLSRLYRLLTGANRVVSNRLSTPVIYAAALGIEVAVHGDPMVLEGEQQGAHDRVSRLYPEFIDASATATERRAVADLEVGVAHLREPAELQQLLGWDREMRLGPWLEHWVGAPAARAVTNLRRRSSAGGATGDGAVAVGGQSAASWLRGALTYLPHPLGVAVDPDTVAPIGLG